MMPNVFGGFDRTEIIAFLATHGAKRVAEVRSAFDVPPESMLRRLRGAEKAGLLERGRGTANYYRLDHEHPAYEQIRDLARRLGTIYGLRRPARPVREVHIRRRLTPPRSYDVVNVFGTRAMPVRSEILLLLAALRQPIPVNFVAGILVRPRYSVSMAVNAFEAFGIVRSQYTGCYRHVSLNETWPAYPELRALLVRLIRLDPQWRAYAANYKTAAGVPSYKI